MQANSAVLRSVSYFMRYKTEQRETIKKRDDFIGRFWRKHNLSFSQHIDQKREKKTTTDMRECSTSRSKVYHIIVWSMVILQ